MASLKREHLNRGQNNVRKKPRDIWAESPAAGAKHRCKGPAAGALEEWSVVARRLKERVEGRVVGK